MSGPRFIDCFSYVLLYLSSVAIETRSVSGSVLPNFDRFDHEYSTMAVARGVVCV